jgi:hypothetical protein
VPHFSRALCARSGDFQERELEGIPRGQSSNRIPRPAPRLDGMLPVIYTYGLP